jgi:hypothetical protein
MVIRAIEHKEDIKLVYSSLALEQQKKHVLNYEGVKLNPNYPFPILSPLNLYG